MQELKVIRTEDDRLIVATESGETFALVIDDVLRAEVRRARGAARDDDSRANRPSPREIQMHIRSGMSAQEVAELLDARVEDVVRFEAPVLAEREHMVGLALAVPVLLGAVDDAEAQPTFGAAIRAKLAEVGAEGERWSSWKEQSEWIVKLHFQVGEIDHDARWSFDPRRSALSPLNADATQLSRQGSLPEGLIPRLRALDNTPSMKDDSRFDSGAFGLRRGSDPVDDEAGSDPNDAAVNRESEPVSTSAETADLLEALRRRRGQREPAPENEVTRTPAPAHAPVALFDALEPGYEAPTGDPSPAEDAPTESEPSSRRRGRAALPSWDEIVFGARGDGE
ncbi:septation protein SepH [Microbacterium sp. LRZ72]|uniref:septation protein SepH n=1 Tax=Microbacterium sp. LRZ72 TaxID=2942481 RepID=UPI0029AE4F20|nr:septation protein SepH [Microbacterium sp. LRZ72]MDX2375339.1 septation protein SepH [Microbacterium sp. LRZ72]